MPNASEFRNLMIAFILSAAILMGWQVYYENPRIQAAKARYDAQAKIAASMVVPSPARETLLVAARRVPIETPSLHGSVSLRGAALDDLTLVKYKQELAANSPDVVLLSPTGNDDTYAVQIGWVATTPDVPVPDENTLWTASGEKLTPQTPITLKWDNGQGLVFEKTLRVDDQYLFSVEQKVTNNTGAAVTLAPYGYINRAYPRSKESNALLHEGALGALSNQLHEVNYQTLREKGKQTVENSTGWLGITDKYWLTALVPGGAQPFTANFSHYESKGLDRYQVDYLGGSVTIPARDSATAETHLFAGAKELPVLDAYSAKYTIPLFDRAVNLGSLYFLTKPIFFALNYFYHAVGNFGVAILILTVCVRLLLFPLANKSYKSMAQMKKLQPEMQRLKEKYADDKLKFNQALIELYKKEKVNPASGCLPLLIQLPVFFALYRVLFVTIEMRHAPFFGWLKDLSAPDPSNLFTLFGLVDWNAPSWLHLGILPILMTVTMVIQQKMNPPPGDPMQAKIMAWLPFMFLFFVLKLPAGLVLYWVWGNILSIGQQYVISKKLNPHHG